MKCQNKIEIGEYPRQSSITLVHAHFLERAKEQRTSYSFFVSSSNPRQDESHARATYLTAASEGETTAATKQKPLLWHLGKTFKFGALLAFGCSAVRIETTGSKLLLCYTPTRTKRGTTERWHSQAMPRSTSGPRSHSTANWIAQSIPPSPPARPAG